MEIKCPEQGATLLRGVFQQTAKRGQFFRAGAQLNLPVYLDKQVQTTLAALASAKGVDLSALINDLLRKDIELIEMAR